MQLGFMQLDSSSNQNLLLMIIKGFTKFVPSEIDLAPSFPTPNPVDYSINRERVIGGYARVSVFPITNGLWRVLISGNDDMGFELDVSTMEEALVVYNEVDCVYGCPKGWQHI